MKKVLLTAAAVFAFTFANAQESTSSYKPVKGTVTTEVGLTGGLNNANFDLNTGVLKFRYFLKDDLGLRLGFATNSNKTESIDNSNPNNVETTINKNSNFTLNLGVEKHFAGTERLSTYAGADLLLNFKGAKTEYTENNYFYNVDGANIDNAGNFINNAGTQFGLRLVTGADYYIAKKVFLGVEAGLNILTGKNKDIEISETGQPNVNIAGGKESGITTQVIGGIRIGYQF
ncbi:MULTISPECIES: outer membrane beta-barrel protein [Flavobacterium]|uniref:Outer membrane protein beta-barrel domain-containing protein n=1 Tax=Flavobacterium hankyongi TaxID=1176532 RepID=A0ABP9A5S5_9FLAO|nr:outer membrane beta-barrel protein [Flavobacterium sp. N1846]